ncbi:Regulator of chromosome condensation [Leishmania braziliensis]|nr:Regulator of chromosome condensation [Leishmania braziliensis]
MLRRLHTRIIGMGSVCGLAPSPPAELFLKTLPSPCDADPVKYRRFQREEVEKHAAQRHLTTVAASPVKAPEPFYDVIDAAAGHKHVVMLTREGNLITVGNNRYGQTGALNAEGQDGEGDAAASPPLSRGGTGHNTRSSSVVRTSAVVADLDPLYIDLDGTFPRTDSPIVRVACGSNFTLVYQHGSRRVIAFGNNHMGQLGVGHKKRIDSGRGFAEWNPTALWWPAGQASVLETVRCGFNHAVATLSDGGLYSFGCNNWGELGTGNSDAPMWPTRIVFFEERGMRVAKVALGNSFTLFLTMEGRVFGCGATNGGQLPPNAFDPVPIPLTRSFQQHRSDEAPHAVGGAPKLIRVKDIACVGSLAVFVSVKNELLIQGSLPEYGVMIPSPRFAAVDQAPVLKYFAARMGAQTSEADDYDIVELVGGPSTLLVRYRNGCVAALGANTEGQLHNVTKVLNGKRVNLAPAFNATELFPMFVPATPLWSTAWFASGKGFNLLFDGNEAYSVPETTAPIELPPGSGRTRRTTPGRLTRPSVPRE